MVVCYCYPIALRVSNDSVTVPLPLLADWDFLGGNLFFSASGFIIGLMTDQADLSAGQFMVAAASGFGGQAMQLNLGSHLISADQCEFAAGLLI